MEIAIEYFEANTKKYVLGCKMQKILVEKYENHIWPIITQNTQQFVDKYLNQILIETTMIWTMISMLL